MKKKNCGDDEQCSLSKVQRKNYEIGAEQTSTFTKVRDRIRFNGGMIYPLLTGHTHRVLLVVIGKNGKKSVDNFMITNDITISMKNLCQHLT